MNAQTKSGGGIVRFFGREWGHCRCRHTDGQDISVIAVANLSWNLFIFYSFYIWF
jgi:hypothetical protein